MLENGWILGLCNGCRGLGWFRSKRPNEWVCPGCGGGRLRPPSRAELAYLRALRPRHATFNNGDLNDLYSLMVHGSENATCEQCGQKSIGVRTEQSRTAYAKQNVVSWKRLLFEDEGLGEIPDPNQPSVLCRPCAKEYHAYWNDMWGEYHASIY